MKINIKKILSDKNVISILDNLKINVRGSICIRNIEGEVLYGENSKSFLRNYPLQIEQNIYGEIESDEECGAIVSFLSLLMKNEMEKKSLATETLERYKEIKLIERISEKITASLTLDQVADLIIEETGKIIKADNVSIMVMNALTGCLEVTASSHGSGKRSTTLKPGEGIAGMVYSTGKAEVINDLASDSRFVRNAGSIKSMMCAPLKTEASVFGVMNLISREDGVNYTAGDLKIFSAIASQAAVAIENARYIKYLTETTAASERLESELKIATKIQSSLLPQNIFAAESGFPFKISACMRHAAQVGGDFYDYFLIDEEHVCFAIGDVSGKGIPAAIFMAMTKTLLKSSVNLYKTPGKILYHLNRDLCKDNSSCMFVTLYLGIMNIHTGVLNYACAGHDPPLLISHGSEVSFLDNPAGGPVGVSEKYRYRTFEITLDKGDVLFLYTDGVTEAIDINGDVFSVERLYKLVEFNRNLPSDKLILEMLEMINDYSAGVAQFDDITMMCIEYSGEN